MKCQWEDVASCMAVPIRSRSSRHERVQEHWWEFLTLNLQWNSNSSSNAEKWTWTALKNKEKGKGVWSTFFSIWHDNNASSRRGTSGIAVWVVDQCESWFCALFCANTAQGFMSWVKQVGLGCDCRCWVIQYANTGNVWGSTLVVSEVSISTGSIPVTFFWF